MSRAMTVAVPLTCEVSVVVPTHNRRVSLRRTLHSVLEQQGVTFEVLVVDDGSGDGTSAAVASCSDPRVSITTLSPARGVSAARNAGLARARGRWVAFLDDDDLWAPLKLARQLCALRHSTDHHWACTGALHFDPSIAVVGYVRPPTPDTVGERIRRFNAIPGGGSGIMVSTATARRLRGFDERISLLADWDFNIRLSRISPPAVIDEALIGYQRHSDSMINDPASHLRELAYLDRKHSTAENGDGAMPLDVDWATTCVDLSMMARRTRDFRLAGLALRTGARRAGVTAVARATGRRVSYKITSRRVGAWTRGLRPDDVAWLDAYRDPRWST